MTDNKKVFNNFTAYYCGKKKDKTGVKPDGTEWKMYKVEVKLKPDSPYGINMKTFSNAKGIELLTEDNEGELLTFNCVVEGYVHKQHGNQISRQMIEVKQAVQNVPSEKILTKDDFYNSSPDLSKIMNPELAPKPTIIPPEATLRVFSQKYKTVIKEEDRSFEHYVIMYMKVLNKYNCVHLFLQNDSKLITELIKKEYESFQDKDLGEVL